MLSSNQQDSSLKVSAKNVTIRRVSSGVVSEEKRFGCSGVLKISLVVEEIMSLLLSI